MFNYIIERKTAFTEDINLMLDHDKLELILKHLDSIDKTLIDQIQYYYESKYVDFVTLI